MSGLPCPSPPLLRLGSVESSPMIKIIEIATALVLPLLGGLIYVVQLSPAVDHAREATVRVEARMDKLEGRTDRIEESRTVGLQRLSKVEEAVQGTQRALDLINAKLDRALSRR